MPGQLLILIISITHLLSSQAMGVYSCLLGQYIYQVVDGVVSHPPRALQLCNCMAITKIIRV